MVIRRVAAAAACSAALLVAASLMPHEAAATGAGPFGVGLPEAGSGAAAASGGWFSGFFGYVAARQSEFYRALTGAISAMKEDGSAAWLLGGLAFLYGIFHAAGPGHGKAVISSYLLANRQTLRNGILLSFASAFAQAGTAIALVGIAAAALGMTGIAMTGLARNMEIGSYAIVTLLGGWLVWSRVLRPAAAYLAAAPVAFAGAGAGGRGTSVELEHGHHGHDHHDHHHAHHHHHADCGCGHAHMPDARDVAGPLDWHRAAAVVASVGFRPCTGALIALVFALSQGLFVAGIFATLAMAVGTGLTVAVLAGLAVGSRDLMLSLSGRGSRLGLYLHRGLEAAGAIAVLLLGLVLLTASLA